MKHFALLVAQLDSTTKTTVKLRALTDYLAIAEETDKTWCVALLMGRRPKRPVRTALMRQWAAEVAGTPLWLFEESYFVVGDLAETIALVLPPVSHSSNTTLSTYMSTLLSLSGKTEAQAEIFVKQSWSEMTQIERFVFNKLITGGFRIGVSQKLMVKALATHYGLEEADIAHKLMGQWTPQENSIHSLISEQEGAENLSRPYPFYLAYPINESVESLGNISDWQLEYKWDGIRGQLIYRKDNIYIWSRGEELVTERFPELLSLGSTLPCNCVIDGEIMAWKDGKPLPFNFLQTRIGRKNLSKQVLSTAPVVMVAYDLLEHNGRDLREEPLSARRILLESIVKETNALNLLLSERLQVESWDDATTLRAQSRKILAEGLMIKHCSSPYLVGRKRGHWWKWKVDPLSIDAVMIYAMKGHGRRANLYSDYTFAVWQGTDLVPFAKAYSGLTDKEMQEVDRFVKKNTIEKFGPVRSVTPELVFEIGFEGIAPSTRHKSGIALRFPRMLRWRKDKVAADANTLDDLRSILKGFNV